MNDTEAAQIAPTTASPSQPDPPLVVRAADDIAQRAAERAEYYGVTALTIVIDRNGIYQIRSTNVDVNTLVGVLSRTCAYLTATMAQPLPPGQLNRN